MALAPNEPDAYLSPALGLRAVWAFTDKALELMEGIDLFVRADHPQLFLQLAELQLKMERFRGVARDGRGIQAGVSGSFRLLRLPGRARELLAKGETEEAATKLTTVVESYPGFARARFYQAVACIESGQKRAGTAGTPVVLARSPGRREGPCAVEHPIRRGPSRPRRLPRTHGPCSRTTTRRQALWWKQRAVLLRRGRCGRRPLRWTPRWFAGCSIPQYNATRPCRAHTRFSAEWLVARGETADAGSVLKRAEQAGVPAGGFARIHAAIALEGGDVEAARQYCDAALAAEGVGLEDVCSWAYLFASRGQLDTGIALLSQAASEKDNSFEANIREGGTAHAIRPPHRRV